MKWRSLVQILPPHLVWTCQKKKKIIKILVMYLPLLLQIFMTQTNEKILMQN
jgi:hypothetical protein